MTVSTVQKDPPPTTDGPHRRAGFGLTEVVVALVVFAVGALGAAALTAHAARLSIRAARIETVIGRTVALLDSLTVATAPAAGSDADPDATYAWSLAGDSAARTISVIAIVRASSDTVRMSAHRPAAPPYLSAIPQ